MLSSKKRFNLHKQLMVSTWTVQEYVLTLYRSYSKSRGWSLSPEQNGSTSKNDKSIRQNSLFFRGNNITETPPKIQALLECLILHNIIFSKSPSKTAKDEKSYTFDNKNERHVKLALSLDCKCASLNWVHYLLSKCLTLVDYFTINLKQRIYSNNLKNKSNKLVFGSVN